MDKGEDYQVLLRKPDIEIGWLVNENILKFNALKSYNLSESMDITSKIVGFMATKNSTRLLINMEVPIIFNKQTLENSINETFHFLHEKDIKSIAYVHHDAISYHPYESFNVPVFGSEAEAISWLCLF